MTNEEFQKIVIEKLGSIEDKVVSLEKGQQEMKEDIKSIIEQTASLSELRYEINGKVDKLSEEFNTIEIVASKNWNDIAKLKAAR
ncbi:hypothetical protein RBU61_16910 [Tissierella sp. MB52-C2]|uniref:hypothetical protein n=1 Tax=Tissierella sp. MB52-C2 TaxID=3070999 RepID=UPI00280B4283|nr:hypothetical protein [Tissierella sp. MB52-C2]WMM24591.1 hypothetical protein RBU61_16910 [Tissierella sp. MB52-C2]